MALEVVERNAYHVPKCVLSILLWIKKEEITVWILGIRKAVVNSLVLGLHVLSDPFESPSDTVEVYRQTNRYSCNGGPCEACCVSSGREHDKSFCGSGLSLCCSQWRENPNFWSEVRIQKNFDRRSVNVLLRQGKIITPVGCKENTGKECQVENNQIDRCVENKGNKLLFIQKGKVPWTEKIFMNSKNLCQALTKEQVQC